MTIGTMSERLKAEVEAMTELVAQIPEQPRLADSLLSRTVTPEGVTLYLCREHYDAYRRVVRL
jgi:hypothetical protein